jgi:hypothetical protein
MKYRVWDKKNNKYFKQGEWETYVWVDHNGKPFEVDITVHGCWMNPKDVSEQYEIEYSIGQRDNSDNLLYINDLVRIKGVGKEYLHKCIYFPVIFYPDSSYELIGNKNENKELWESL